MIPKSTPKPDSQVRKIWRDPVWASVIATTICGIGAFALTQTTNVFAGEEVEEHKAASVVCTAVGPLVNVRSSPNVESSMVFQVSKGEYFHIIENGKEDVVNGKNGRWKRIAYEKKKGWMFSAYMQCE